MAKRHSSKPKSQVSDIRTIGPIGYIQTHFGCHGVPILGRSPIKFRQRADITMSRDLNVAINQTDNLVLP